MGSPSLNSHQFIADQYPCMMDFTKTLFCIISLLVHQNDGLGTIMEYSGSYFLVKTQCPNYVSSAKFQQYQECIQKEPLQTLCMIHPLRGGRTLVVPSFTNSCSATCHGLHLEDFVPCPKPVQSVQGARSNFFSYSGFI